MSIECKNAQIISTKLGFEDHGIFTCFLELDYGNGRQSFGGYMLSRNHPDDTAGLHHDYGMQFLKRILEVVGVETWEKLEGKYIRVKADRERICAIGNIIQDKWFDPSELKNT